MTDEPLSSLMSGVLSVAALAFITSLCGIPVIARLSYVASLRNRKPRVTASDMIVLLIAMVMISGFVWSIFPDGDELDAGIYIVASWSVAAVWGLVCIAQLSKAGIAPAARGIFHLVVVPVAFVAPLFVGIDILTVTQSHSVRPPMKVDSEFARIALCAVAYVLCFPITGWVLKQDDPTNATPRT